VANKQLAKLHALGIDCVLLDWNSDLFTNRTFQSRINDLLSAVCDLLSGVIQGSAIGPLMFLIYVNDLVELPNNYSIVAKLFANDVKLYIRVSTQNDVVELQKALSAFFLGSKNSNFRCL